jgi:hypothetical protein
MITPPLILDANVFRCEIDGSYADVSNVGYGGVGMVLARGEQLIRHATTHFLTTSPL